MQSNIEGIEKRPNYLISVLCIVDKMMMSDYYVVLLYTEHR